MAYEPPPNDEVDFTLESYDQPNNDAVDFDFSETEESETEPAEPFELDANPLSLPFELDLPMSAVNLRQMDVGLSIFLVGVLALVGGGSVLLRNPVALALSALSVVALLMSGTLGLSLGYFWALVILTGIALMVGAVGRVILS